LASQRTRASRFGPDERAVKSFVDGELLAFALICLCLLAQTSRHRVLGESQLPATGADSLHMARLASSTLYAGATGSTPYNHGGPGRIKPWRFN